MFVQQKNVYTASSECVCFFFTATDSDHSWDDASSCKYTNCVHINMHIQRAHKHAHIEIDAFAGSEHSKSIKVERILLSYMSSVFRVNHCDVDDMRLCVCACVCVCRWFAVDLISPPFVARLSGIQFIRFYVNPFRMFAHTAGVIRCDALLRILYAIRCHSARLHYDSRVVVWLVGP